MYHLPGEHAVTFLLKTLSPKYNLQSDYRIVDIASYTNDSCRLCINKGNTFVKTGEMSQQLVCRSHCSKTIS